VSIFLTCLLILFCIVASAFFSGAETALVVADRIRLRHLVEKKDRKAQIVQNLRARPQTFLGTTLVGTNLAIVGGSVLATRLVSQLMGQSSSLAALVQTLIMTPVILIFAEIVPKNFFRIHADSMVLRLAPWIQFSYRVLRPLVCLATGAETSVREVMVPLDRVVATEWSSTPVEVVELIKREGKSRIPVYRNTPGQITGVVDINHLLTSERNTPLEDLVYPVPRVRDETSARCSRFFCSCRKKDRRRAGRPM